MLKWGVLNSSAWVYVLQAPEPDTFYIGKTVDLPRRLSRHRENATRGYSSYELLCFLPCESEPEARILERQVMGEIRGQGFTTNYVWGYEQAVQ